MAPLRSTLTVLEQSAQKFATLPAFRLPVTGPGTGEVVGWKDITYAEFYADVERVAKFWLAELKLSPRSIVGLWLGGMKYFDVVHAYAIARAGFIPQYFSLRLPNPDAVYALMSQAGAAALIYDASNATMVAKCPVPAFLARRLDEIAKTDSGVVLPPLGQDVKASGTFSIFHSSGSTSGLPKVIPCSYAWIDATTSKAEFLCRRRNPSKQDVATIIASLMHIAQSFMLNGALANGSCIIEPPRIPFTPSELVLMVRDAKLNCLRTFGSFLSSYIRAAAKDPEILEAMQSLDEAFYAGISLSDEDEAFARANGIELRNTFGTTEVGALLYSPDGEDFLVQVPGTKYEFRPLEAESAEAEGERETEKLLELVVLRDLETMRDSTDRPDASLCDGQGEFHTGDLFHEVKPGKYTYRGRADDWIKSLFSLRIDTRAIEDNLRATCSDLVSDCIVVGWGRPSPVLFLESGGERTADELKEAVLRRIAPFHANRYTHERIVEARYIMVVAKGTLPRTSTKGNIRRRAAEEQFKDVLDLIYE
ncbi:acetyl-CoA synthetase-like protein [Auricularia subglabra TFB-10046 SS5]|nr:acetyl-CoA synthetase-like protein [Auricularia subglabra TFB-10046 SS5]